MEEEPKPCSVCRTCFLTFNNNLILAIINLKLNVVLKNNFENILFLFLLT